MSKSTKRFFSIALAVLIVLILTGGYIVMTSKGKDAEKAYQPDKIVSVKVGKPVILSDDYGWFPKVKRWSDGTIAVSATQAEHNLIDGKQFMAFYNHLKNGGGFSKEELSKKGFNDINLGAGYWAIESRDGGSTWSKVNDDIYRTFIGLGTVYELSDGTLIANYILSFNTEKGQELIIYRSPDKGLTWKGPEFIPMYGPPQKDPSWGGGHMGGAYYGGIIEGKNGETLLFGHTYFPGDQRTRVVVYRSTDRAKSFRYYSTVAYEVSNVSSLRPIGFNEPGAVKLKNGEIVCYMRTAEYEPIFQARSRNGGKTWSEPVPVGVDGILPTPVLMSNGVLALSYGAPGIWVMFSPDGIGKRWTDKTCIWIWNSLIEQGHVPQARHYIYNVPKELQPKPSAKYPNKRMDISGCRALERSDCNARICEIAPGRLLVVYSAPTNVDDMSVFNSIDPDQREHFSIWGVTIDTDIK